MQCNEKKDEKDDAEEQKAGEKDAHFPPKEEDISNLSLDELYAQKKLIQTKKKAFE